MRTYLSFVLVAVFLSVGCAEKHVRTQSPTVPSSPETDLVIVSAPVVSDKMTLPEVIAYLEKKPDNETPEDKKRRELALEIAKKEYYKTLKKQVQKKELRVEREADKIIEKQEEDPGKQAKNEANVKRRSDIVCTTPEETAKVWIHPDASKPIWGFVHSAMTIINNKDYPMMIRQTGGDKGRIVVRHFCPGGSMVLIQRIDWTSGMTYISYVAVPDPDYIAANREKDTPKGRIESFQSPQIYLQPCYGQGCRGEYPAVWNIR